MQARLLFCRSSDLLRFALPSHLQTIEAVAKEVVKQTHYWSLQQRDCPGLSPDSLFIRALALESHAEQNWGKDKGFF